MPLRTGPIRARDLRANIKEMGFEKGIVLTLELLMDEFVHTRQQLREIVELQSKCIDQIQNFIVIGHGIRTSMETMRRNQEKGNVIDHGDKS